MALLLTLPAAEVAAGLCSRCGLETSWLFASLFSAR